MSNELKILVDKIKYLKNWNVEEVAKSINYGRVHLTNEMKKTNFNQQLFDLLYEKHKDLIENVLRDDGIYENISLKDQVKAHAALFSVLVSEVAALRSASTGEPVQSLIMKYYKAAEDAGSKLGG